MATNDAFGPFLRRVARDMQAPMALLVANHPHRRVVAQRGFEHPSAVRRLLAVDPEHGRMINCPTGSTSVGIHSWATAAVEYDGLEVGSLFVADRRRRYFDDDEIRHLGLMTFVAAPLIVDLAAAPVEAVDVRTASERLAALA